MSTNPPSEARIAEIRAMAYSTLAEANPRAWMYERELLERIDADAERITRLELEVNALKRRSNTIYHGNY